MMAYQLVFTKRAQKDIKKLDRVAQKKLAAKLQLLAQKPFFYGQKLSLAKLGGYRFWLGNYRVVFDIDNKKIVILRVGHRKEIYRL